MYCAVSNAYRNVMWCWTESYVKFFYSQHYEFARGRTCLSRVEHLKGLKCNHFQCQFWWYALWIARFFRSLRHSWRFRVIIKKYHICCYWMHFRSMQFYINHRKKQFYQLMCVTISMDISQQAQTIINMFWQPQRLSTHNEKRSTW